MAKKENQWLIDRAFNFDCSNESKIMSVLKNIYRCQNKECSYNDAVHAIVSEGGTPSFERYERSTQTLFKSYGLELSKDEILPISIAFVEGIINFKELALLQCFKKQYMDNRSHIIRPLIITLSFLYKAYENHITKEYAWIDAYDYMTYLTEITNYSDIDSVFDAFITDKSLSVEDRHIDEVKDCDIWYNFFVTTGLFCKDEEVKYKLYMNLDELDLIKYLLNYHINASYINPGENWLVNFGSLNIGLSEILPTLNIKCNNVSIDIDDSIVNEVLYCTLVEGLSANECDDVVLEKLGHNFLTKGLVTSYILNKFSIPNSYENNLRGVFRPFKNYLGILNFSKEYHEVKNIIERITGIKQKHKLLSIERKIGGSNMIYYGTPGCGKSYLVDEIYNKPNNKVYRTVFHPEYSNSDFVGQIMPRVNKSDNKSVIYEFIPGIFTQALKFAVNNPNVSVYLIIEEINRGNASAIFGEIFQLLDRNTDGTSIYSVKNSNIAEQLGEFEDFDIKIPSNLSLIATMNTSDQNVYTLDTAFKRRWDLIKIRNTFDDVKGEHKVPENLKYKHYLGNLYVPGTDITWLKFVESINAKISSKGKTFTIVSEDKELGVYFVTPKYLSLNKNDNTIDLVKMFAEKVLMYLWNDIAKTDPDKWFVFEEGQAKTLDNLLKNFEKNASSDALKVFAQGIFSKIQNSVIGE